MEEPSVGSNGPGQLQSDDSQPNVAALTAVDEPDVRAGRRDPEPGGAVALQSGLAEGAVDLPDDRAVKRGLGELAVRGAGAADVGVVEELLAVLLGEALGVLLSHLVGERLADQPHRVLKRHGQLGDLHRKQLLLSLHVEDLALGLVHHTLYRPA